MTFHANGDNLHEMSNPVFCEKKKIINLSSAEFAQRVEMVNLYNVTVSLDVKLIDTDMEYRNNAKFWDRQAQENSVGLDQ